MPFFVKGALGCHPYTNIFDAISLTKPARTRECLWIILSVLWIREMRMNKLINTLRVRSHLWWSCFFQMVWGSVRHLACMASGFLGWDNQQLKMALGK